MIIATFTRHFDDGCELIVKQYTSGVIEVDEAMADTPWSAPVVEYTERFEPHQRGEFGDYLRGLLDEYEAHVNYGLWFGSTGSHGISVQFNDEQMTRRFS